MQYGIAQPLGDGSWLHCHCMPVVLPPPSWCDFSDLSHALQCNTTTLAAGRHGPCISPLECVKVPSVDSCAGQVQPGLSTVCAVRTPLFGTVYCAAQGPSNAGRRARLYCAPCQTCPRWHCVAGVWLR
jgi:hypothetical protein